MKLAMAAKFWMEAKLVVLVVLAVVLAVVLSLLASLLLALPNQFIGLNFLNHEPPFCELIILYDLTYCFNKFLAGFIGTLAMNFIECELSKSSESLYCDLKDDLRLHLKGFKLDQEMNDGLKVVLGIRPEDLIHAPVKKNKSLILSAQLEVVEPLGAETLLICKGDYGEITGKTNQMENLKWGKLIHFEVDPSKIHVFDYQAGTRISKKEF